jgi:malate dehydrogenase (oxaloacetate-decarboxylating)
MTLAAAHEVAQFAQERGISETSILPRMDEWEVFPREAAAVAVKAQEQGVARLSISWDQIRQHAAKLIRGAQEATQILMREGYIPHS